MPTKTEKTKKWPKRLAIALIAIIVVSIVGFYVYVSDYYHAGNTAGELTQELKEVHALEETDQAIKVGNPQAETGIVIYPGAKVDPYAYVPLVNELNEYGYYCVIAKMPFNLAFFGIDVADSLMDEAPEVGKWWIAGHSLGGAMAAQFASTHSSELQGVFLLAAYAATDLSFTNLEVDLIYGSNDGVLNRTALEENASNLPEDSRTIVIEGGNHAGFGDYGPQEGDGDCVLGASQQWEDVAHYLDEAIAAQSKELT